jgi:hypothetical protein
VAVVVPAVDEEIRLEADAGGTVKPPGINDGNC